MRTSNDGLARMIRGALPLVGVFMAAACTALPTPSNALVPRSDPRGANCLIPPGDAIVVAQFQDVGPASRTFFSEVDVHGDGVPGLLVVGRGEQVVFLAGTPPGLGLQYPACVVVGPDRENAMAHNTTTYSGTTLPLPSGPFVLP